MSPTTPRPFTFALPPSLGPERAAERARRLAAHLTAALAQPVAVAVPDSYEELAGALTSGRMDAAWAPPFVCARLEASGLRIAVRAVRRGSATYRSALVMRAGAALSLEGLAGRTVAWVDPHATSGYLLPLAFLKGRGISPRTAGLVELFAGSYREALEAVLAGRADLAAVFAPAAAADDPSFTVGIESVLPGRGRDFALLATTDEVPNDGVALSPRADAEALARLESVLLGLQRSGEGRQLLHEAFEAERFEPAPPQGFRALYRVALAGL